MYRRHSISDISFTHCCTFVNWCCSFTTTVAIYYWQNFARVFLKTQNTRNMSDMWSCRSFLSRVSILTRDTNIGILFVCPSVRPSVCLSVRNVPLLDENGLTYCDSFFSPYGSPITLGFISIKHLHEIPTGSPPCGGTKYRWGIKNFRP